MMKRNLSPDEATGGSGASEVAAEPNFASLSEDFFEPSYNPKEVAAEKKIEEKVDAEANEQDAELSLEPQEKTAEETKPEKEEVAQEETKEEILELKLDDTNLNPELNQTKVWQETAKELLGLEVAEDSYEAFAEATKQAIEAAREEGKQTSIEKELALLDPAAQVDFILLREGYTREQINEPTKEIDDILSLSNVDIVKKDLELKGLSEGLIEKEIELLTERGIIDHEAEKLKIILHDAKDSVIAQRADLARQVATNYEAKQQAIRQAEAETMATAFNTVKDFMGIPVNEATRKQLANLYAEGKYDSILNDPAKKAEFILQYHFGEQAVKSIRNKALEEGREKVTKHLSNIPPVPQHNNSKGAVKSSAKTSSGFDSLNSLFGTD